MRQDGLLSNADTEMQVRTGHRMVETEQAGFSYYAEGAAAEFLSPMNLSGTNVTRRVPIPKLNGYTSGLGRLGIMKKFAPVRLQSGQRIRGHIQRAFE